MAIDASDPAVLQVAKTKKPRTERQCEREGCTTSFTPRRNPNARFCSPECRLAQWEQDNPRVNVRELRKIQQST